ncbi:MAG: arginine--tRNA ligase [Acidobacteria bacterium]|nr:arginine--tRNA ligase [Acidobacteriota bacterium]
MSEKNLLSEFNTELQKSIVAKRAVVEARRAATPPKPFSAYAINSLAARIASLLGLTAEELDISFVDTAKFKADLALRVPGLLKSKPTPVYIKEDVPRFASLLQPLISEGVLTAIEPKGIYLNLSLGQSVLLNAAEQVLDLKEAFGGSDQFAGRRFVIDYSSPNVAKHLHAGHIRSTIIGHVLSNMYEAVGGISFRLNYLNDWGGFGELIEGFDRWAALAPAGVAGNDLLFFVYSTYRSAEKAAGSAKEFSELSAEQKEVLSRAFPGALTSNESFKGAFDQFKAASRVRFANLEAGKAAEVARWKEMVAWSLADFERFYSLLDIHHDFTLGESFYAERGRAIVEAGLTTGAVLKFSQQDAERAIAQARADKDSGAITEEVCKVLEEEIKRDIGAYVVPLSGNRRMVVQRADGATIYATRDLAGVQHRFSTFDATDLIYEVGQEQADHFAQLFEAGKILNLTSGKEVSCKHIYHGFYVEAGSKKKLSSRQGASSVLSLFESAVEHFFKKYDESSEFPLEERRSIARTLAVGAVVFNDLRRDKKLPVELNPDKQKMIEEFERSGGAYVVYSVCRARSIIRKANAALPRAEALKAVTLEPIERELIKLTMDFPRRLLNAVKNDNPAAIITFVEEAATLYNRYYHEYPVIKGGEQNFHRLSITEAVAQMIENGLRICHSVRDDVRVQKIGLSHSFGGRHRSQPRLLALV